MPAPSPRPTPLPSHQPGHGYIPTEEDLLLPDNYADGDEAVSFKKPAANQCFPGKIKPTESRYIKGSIKVYNLPNPFIKKKAPKDHSRALGIVLFGCLLTFIAYRRKRASLTAISLIAGITFGLAGLFWK